MAWSSAALDAAESAAFAADYPILLASHVLRDGIPTAYPWTQTGATGDTNHAAAFAPTKRAWDGFAHAGLHTYPDNNAATWFLCFALTTPQEFDTLVLHGSNLDLADVVQIDIADNAEFTTNMRVIWQATGAATGARAVVTNLKYGGTELLRYSGVSFLRLEVDRTIAFAPRVRELWLGRRRQLVCLPERPLSDRREETVAAPITSKSGVRTNWVTERRGAARLYAFTTTAVQLAPLTGWWSDSLRGTRPFYLIENPESKPHAYLMRCPQGPSFYPVNIGNGVCEITVEMREQNPFLVMEP